MPTPYEMTVNATIAQKRIQSLCTITFIGRTARQKQTSEHILTVHTQDQEIRFAAFVALESLALCFGVSLS
ncbi:hypothetical protein AWENTII_003187 [Aspergillus wentii]